MAYYTKTSTIVEVFKITEGFRDAKRIRLGPLAL